MVNFIAHAWAIWILVAIIAGLGELLVPYFALIFVCFAAVFAALASIWVGWPAQIVVFVAALFASLALLRPLLVKRVQSTHGMHSRSERLLGLTGEVTEAIDGSKGSGRVMVNGEDWSARAEHAIASGAKVHIVSSDGIVLHVKEV